MCSLWQLILGVALLDPKVHWIFKTVNATHAGEQGALWVEEADGAGLSLLTEPAQLEALIDGLNRRGIRERGLLNNLKRRQQPLTDMLHAQTPEFVADLADINKCAHASLLHAALPMTPLADSAEFSPVHVCRVG